jgi:hypothetical protein
MTWTSRNKTMAKSNPKSPFAGRWRIVSMSTWYGHIEIGDQESFGFVVRALDCGGLVFEDDKADTLAEAMAALEKGLAEYFVQEGIE